MVKKMVDGLEFVKALSAAGIVPDYGNVYRVIIDCTVGQPIRVYVEGYGAEEMLQLITPELKEAQVTIVGKA